MLDPYEKKSSTLDSLLGQFGKIIGNLQDDSNQLGTGTDSEQFRKTLADKMTRGSTLMKNLQMELEDFKNMQISYNKERERDSKYDALSSNFQSWVAKFKSICEEI